MGFGIIAAGMAQGAGEAGVKAGQIAQKQLGDEDLLRMRVEADRELAISMENLRNTNATNRDIASEQRKRAPAIQAAKAAEGIIAQRVQGTNQAATDEAASLAGGGAPITAQTALPERDEALIRARELEKVGESDAAHRYRQDVRDIDRIAADERRSEKALRSHERISEATLASHKELAELTRKSQERIAGFHASIQREIARMGSTAVTTNDGSILMVDKMGKPIDYVRDPITGERVVGKKDLPESSLALIRSLAAENKGHEAIAKSPDSTPEQRAAATAQIRENADEMYRLAGVEKPAKAPSTKTGWDSDTGAVYVNGKSVGTAKTEAEARSVAAKAKAPANAPATSTSPSKPRGIIAAAADPMLATYEAEQREMDAGKRQQFSQEVLDWIGKPKKLGNSTNTQSELERAQAETRTRIGSQ